MSSGPIDDSAAREQLSALVDGELDPAAAVRACAGWRDDAGCRATWHAYHLIGDVLRSDDLASDASRFMNGATVVVDGGILNSSL